jgi:uncharacterized protein (TIGR03085 family)
MTKIAAQTERAALCDLFLEVGPDAPTLCEGWTTRDLAAHLVVRERRPDGAIGILVSALHGYSEKVRLAEADRTWPDLVERVRNGPPRWSPTRIDAIDRLTNTTEYFVHHEDVRRAVEGWQPRLIDGELISDLTAAVRRMAKLMTRKAPCGIVLEPTTSTTLVAKSGEPKVVLRGGIDEIALFLFGRQQHTTVEIDGPPELAAAVRTASFGV